MVAVLLGVMLGLPPIATVWLLTVLVLVGAWEWAGFLGNGAPAARAAFTIVVALALVACALSVYTGRPDFVRITHDASPWRGGSPRSCGCASRPAQRDIRVTAALAGLLSLVPCWLALVLRHVHDAAARTGCCSRSALVWAADTGAFFAGRWLGRVPLAPRVSPKKTWEGVLGGVLASARRRLDLRDRGCSPWTSGRSSSPASPWRRCRSSAISPRAC